MPDTPQPQPPPSPFAVDPAVREHMLLSIWQSFVQMQAENAQLRQRVDELEAGAANGAPTARARPTPKVA